MQDGVVSTFKSSLPLFRCKLQPTTKHHLQEKEREKKIQRSSVFDFTHTPTSVFLPTHITPQQSRTFTFPNSYIWRSLSSLFPFHFSPLILLPTIHLPTFPSIIFFYNTSPFPLHFSILTSSTLATGSAASIVIGPDSGCPVSRHVLG